MRCLACDKSLSEADARARYDHGEFYELCGGCRWHVKNYGSPLYEPDTEHVFEAVDDSLDGDAEQLRLVYGRAERREQDEGW